METEKDTDLEKLLTVGRTVKKKQYADLIAKAGSGLSFTAEEMRLFEKLHKEFEEEGQAPATGPTLPSQTAVAEYLESRGYKAAISTVHRHKEPRTPRRQSQTALFPSPTSTLSLLQHLKRLDGARKGVKDDAYSLRIAEETRKLHAQADHWEIRAKEAAGQTSYSGPLPRMRSPRAR